MPTSGPPVGGRMIGTPVASAAAPLRDLKPESNPKRGEQSAVSAQGHPSGIGSDGIGDVAHPAQEHQRVDEPGDVAVAKTLWPAQSAGTKPQERGSNPSQPGPTRSWMSQGTGQPGQNRHRVPLRLSVDPSARHPFSLPPRRGLRKGSLLGGLVTETHCVLAGLIKFCTFQEVSRHSNIRLWGWLSFKAW